jgi:NAD(P)-dependent dehydrogenase (short-subunit alcohol dehydrogenase family)
LVYLKAMTRIAVVTGATRNLGLALVQELAQRLAEEDCVYLTGRDRGRVLDSLRRMTAGRAKVVAHELDVGDGEAVEAFAAALLERHGGVDIVFSNHYHRTDPGDDPARVIDTYVAVNNLGTTNLLRCFPPILRDGARLFVVASRAGSLRALAPILHPKFERAETLDDIDRAICSWRDSVRAGKAPGQGWPAWINIPSKIGQVAAVRVLAGQRREADARRGIMIAAISPGLIDTGASRPWLDMTGARDPAEVAKPLVEFALERQLDTTFYGELVHLGSRESAGLSGVFGFRSLVPWK